MLRAVCMLMCAAKSSTISLCLASLLPALQRPVSLPHICSTLERHHLQDKLQLYLDRLLILQQRLRRHPLFNKPALSGMGGSHQDYCEVSQALKSVGLPLLPDGPDSLLQHCSRRCVQQELCHVQMCQPSL